MSGGALIHPHKGERHTYLLNEDATKDSHQHHNIQDVLSALQIERLCCDQISADELQCCRELLLKLLTAHDLGGLS